MTFARETWVVFYRCLKINLRNPVWLGVSLAQPVLYLVLFGPLLEKVVAATPDFPPGDAWQVFVPGLLVQQAMLGTAFVGYGLLFEYRSGVLERHRVTPAGRLALLTGRVLQEVLTLVVQASIMIALAVPFGLRASAVGVLVGLLIVAGLAATFASLSYATALYFKTEDALGPLVESVTIPLLLLSGILLPMTLAPRWLQHVADVNPLKHVVDAARAAFRGDLASAGWGLVVVAALATIGLGLGTAVVRRETA